MRERYRLTCEGLAGVGYHLLVIEWPPTWADAVDRLFAHQAQARWDRIDLEPRYTDVWRAPDAQREEDV